LAIGRLEAETLPPLAPTAATDILRSRRSLSQ
jgi:hypothetical protein